MIHSMLYATDLGVYAPFVMQHALALARTFNAELYVIHAVEPMGQFAESLLQSYLDEQTLDELHSEGVNTVMANIEQRVLENFRDELGEEADLALIRAVRVRQGDPAQVIIEQAKRLSVDLLIFGSHSQGAGVDVPIGRTAARLLQLSPVPIYMVPLAQHLGRRKG
ncbi:MULTISPECIES: universal stress protein [Pseudomonas]|uniref:Universal stress protein n=2 Tax=Pseudomonas TaxID=286 RepID=A0AAX0VRB4_9PSED|nr:MULTISPECIES: universal stress protein [Pseudomonas]MBH3361108.1 universal stress protein [Pseudomonas guariconensis]MCO7624675.1 universal stress protein [Pseudomonas guariconensis]MDD2093008.1 universal stress protein [Pseudomonas guariconensis]MDM9594919.1 universal stress protein [Pseudomonas guariconensis]MDM9607750.1 universal stress protein [Pseudomonas guariconensis]